MTVTRSPKSRSRASIARTESALGPLAGATKTPGRVPGAYVRPIRTPRATEVSWELTVDGRRQTADSRRQMADCGRQTAGNGAADAEDTDEAGGIPGAGGGELGYAARVAGRGEWGGPKDRWSGRWHGEGH